MTTKSRLKAVSGVLAAVAIALTVIVAVSPASTASTASAASAAACTLTPTNGTVKKTIGTRSYTVNVPSGLSGSQVPLLLVLHGFGSTSAQVETFTGWTPFAASHDFIVAYPQARPSEYGGGWDPYSSASEDVAFLKSVVADISAKWCVDPKRVHVDGWSNGAVMSQRMACDAAGTFASAVSYGGGTPTLSGFAKPCKPSRPISVGLFAGQYDFTYAGLAQNTDEWRAVDQCGQTPAHSDDQYGTTDVYSCASGTKVLSRVVKNVSHNWPSGAQGEDQRTRMWSFLTANPLP